MDKEDFVKSYDFRWASKIIERECPSDVGLTDFPDENGCNETDCSECWSKATSEHWNGIMQISSDKL